MKKRSKNLGNFEKSQESQDLHSGRFQGRRWLASEAAGQARPAAHEPAERATRLALGLAGFS